MAPRRKKLSDYESEAVRVGECLLHPAHGIARKVYQMRHGALKAREYVCHKCDTPKCIEDSHHFIGAARDNVHDAVQKGRHACCRRGERANHARLTEADVKDILASEESCAVLGERYGVHLSTISKIRTGVNWPWISRP